VAELPAELRVNTRVVLTVDIHPGDTVLIPVHIGFTQKQVNDAKATLEEQFPGVTFQFVGSTMTHALVYRPVAP
jgi:hypothetical protein